ncbi:GGDEF domain-containing protein [Maricaulis salignorans]|uniref:diguanylate cyclase n=1 Tax=Maricaulis salignorans TaxID=144026 RepID=A0A1G9UGH0_9PROT|nr:GGDEF domain-containing protein [Maricaulis salignorans]SDM58655.1 diguanylate cyclase [Maricaulis salignorans]
MNGRLLGKDGKEFAQKALDLMEQFDVPPTPENYAVWISFASDTNPELCESVRSHIQSAAAFTPEVSSDLFDQYFQWHAIQDAILESGGVMSEELGHVRETLRAAEADTLAYGETLAGATSQLDGAVTDPGIKKLVESLVSATAKMQRRSHDLESKLQATSKEVTKLRDNLERVREEAMTDALTGIANRKRFDESLRKARREADTHGTPLSLVLCDIDFFKRFNDTWGHQTGDQIIRFVAGCLTRHAPESHIVARYGGEEFGIVMPAATPQEAYAIAEKIRSTVESKKLLRKSTNEDLGNITISMGIASFEAGESIESLIERADTHLYRSKTEGRNRTTTDGAENQLGRSAA